MRRTRTMLGLLMLLAMVDSNLGQMEAGQSNLTVLETLIVRARCQSRCNDEHGYQERRRQIDLFDHYLPFVCPADQHYNCTQCTTGCTGAMDDPTQCKQQCESEVCRSSCEFLHTAFKEEGHEPGKPSIRAQRRDLPPAARTTLTVTRPKAICAYTPVKVLFPDPKSLVRLHWNVVDVTGFSTFAPLTFVVAFRRCAPSDGDGCSPVTPWTFFAKTTNFSVVPVYDLEPNTTYIFKVVAVHWSGYIPGVVVSDPVKTPPIQEELGTPLGLSVGQQYVRAGHLRAIVSWKAPPESGGCFFRLYSMPPSGTYEMMEIKYWGELKHELSSLRFNSLYTVELYNSDEEFLLHSPPATFQFHTLHSCLEATDYDYNLCAPEKPNNVKLKETPPYQFNSSSHEMCDLIVTWDPPQHRRHRNYISNYTLSYRKAPDMHNADVIQPHRGTIPLPPTATNYTIRHCHWDGIYEVTLNAESKGGRSEEVTVSIILGNGYAELYDNLDTELVEDNSVLYATAAPALLGVAAVVVCVLYRYRMRSSNRLSLADQLHREELNPLYECSAKKEEEKLLMADEYEIDFSSLHIIQIIGEGAFGKVLKAELDTSSLSGGRRSTQLKTVAVKMLKEHATPDERRNLLLEIEAMKQLGQHPNIVSIVACVTSASRPCLVMHYCPLGDLRNFLRKQRDKVLETSRDNSKSTCDTSTESERHGQRASADSGISYASRTSQYHRVQDGALVETRSDPEGPGAVGGVLSHSGHSSSGSSCSDHSGAQLMENSGEAISQTTLLSFARQIAIGMEFLAERKFIHRDLAARNILLYNHRQLKISDFGLARDVYETSVYQPTSARKLPYKWMAIESIFDQIFTIKSDVWAFGIVLWEIVTLGGCPYPGIPNKDLFRLLKEGYRMEKPENCSAEIYKMMLSCWHPRPEDRPSFSELRQALEGSLEKSQSYIDLGVAVSADYYKHDTDDSSSNDHTSSFGFSRQQCAEYSSGPPENVTSDTEPATDHDSELPPCHAGRDTVRATADVHDETFAQSVILQAPDDDSQHAPGTTPEEGKDGEGKETSSTAPPSSIVLKEEVEKKTEKREADDSKEKNETSFRMELAYNSDGCGVGCGVPTRGEKQVGQGEEKEIGCDEGSQEGEQSAPVLNTCSRSGRSSSSTDLTCDCDSPDDLSDTSVSSGRSNVQRVMVRHAPSLTYGLLSLLRNESGKVGTGPTQKIQNGHKRQSRSLTDVKGVGIELENFGPRMAYTHSTIVHL